MSEKKKIIKPISFVPIKNDGPRKEILHVFVDLKFLKIDVSLNKKIKG